MNLQKGILIATSMIAFSTSFGVLVALINLVYQIKQMGLIEIFLYSEIYISIHLLALLILKRLFK